MCWWILDNEISRKSLGEVLVTWHWVHCTEACAQKDQIPNFQRQTVICGISLSKAHGPEPLMPLISYVYASPSPMKSHHRSSEMQKAHHQTKPMLRPTQEKENPMQMSLSRRYSIFKGDHGQVLPSTLVDWLAVHDIGMSFVEFWYRRKATDGGYSALLTA